MPQADRWLDATWPRVREQLPDPPARVLELGCGTVGGHVPRLRAAGYDAIGVDPAAPDGTEYRQIELERYERDGRTHSMQSSPRRPSTTWPIPPRCSTASSEILAPGGRGDRDRVGLGGLRRGDSRVGLRPSGPATARTGSPTTEMHGPRRGWPGARTSAGGRTSTRSIGLRELLRLLEERFRLESPGTARTSSPTCRRRARRTSSRRSPRARSARPASR